MSYAFVAIVVSPRRRPILSVHEAFSSGSRSGKAIITESMGVLSWGTAGSAYDPDASTLSRYSTCHARTVGASGAPSTALFTTEIRGRMLVPA
ncbi:MAG: hypothetical protein IPI01_03645 [Ignavibacteriae bacterium]|nr:hypothetical protein [Ignavibacteriota bacterium]